MGYTKKLISNTLPKIKLMERRSQYFFTAFWWNLAKAFLFWEKPSIETFAINTLYPIEGAPIILSWETKRSLWVSIKGAKGIFPPKGSLAIVLKGGERQIQITAYGLATRANASLAFHVNTYEGKNIAQLVMSTPNPQITWREKIADLVEIGEIRIPKFELKLYPTKINNPEIILYLDTRSLNEQFEATRAISTVHGVEEFKHQYK